MYIVSHKSGAVEVEAMICYDYIMQPVFTRHLAFRLPDQILWRIGTELIVNDLGRILKPTLSCLMKFRLDQLKHIVSSSQLIPKPLSSLLSVSVRRKIGVCESGIVSGLA